MSQENSREPLFKEGLYNVKEWKSIVDRLLLKIKILELPPKMTKNIETIFEQLIIAQKATNDYYSIAEESIKYNYILREKLYNYEPSSN